MIQKQHQGILCPRIYSLNPSIPQAKAPHQRSHPQAKLKQTGAHQSKHLAEHQCSRLHCQQKGVHQLGVFLHQDIVGHSLAVKQHHKVKGHHQHKGKRYGEHHPHRFNLLLLGSQGFPALPLHLTDGLHLGGEGLKLGPVQSRFFHQNQGRRLREELFQTGKFLQIVIGVVRAKERQRQAVFSLLHQKNGAVRKLFSLTAGLVRGVAEGILNLGIPLRAQLIQPVPIHGSRVGFIRHKHLGNRIFRWGLTAAGSQFHQAHNPGRKQQQ